MKNVNGDAWQGIEFVRRRDHDARILPKEKWHQGILSQQLIRVLVDRVLYLHAEAPCNEDTEIIRNLRECLALFESRAARRTIEKLAMLEREPVCPNCQHVLCLHQEDE